MLMLTSGSCLPIESCVSSCEQLSVPAIWPPGQRQSATTMHRVKGGVLHGTPADGSVLLRSTPRSRIWRNKQQR